MDATAAACLCPTSFARVSCGEFLLSVTATNEPSVASGAAPRAVTEGLLGLQRGVDAGDAGLVASCWRIRPSTVKKLSILLSSSWLACDFSGFSCRRTPLVILAGDPHSQTREVLAATRTTSLACHPEIRQKLAYFSACHCNYFASESVSSQ